MRLTIAFAGALLGLAALASAQGEEKAPVDEPTKEKQPVEEPKEEPPLETKKYPEGTMVVDLVAGETETAGTVAVWNDSDYLYVEYRTSGAWTILKTHLDVELDPADIPQNKKGNPMPGKFEFKGKHGEDEVTEVLYEIPLADKEWSAGDIVYVAAHAKLALLKKKGKTTKEHAWGDGEEFPGPKWAMYFPYEIDGASKEKTPPVTKEVEDGTGQESDPGPGDPAAAGGGEEADPPVEPPPPASPGQEEEA